MTHKNNKNKPESDGMPEFGEGLAIAVGPRTVKDFFTIYDPNYVEENLLDLFHWAVGNPEFQPGAEASNYLSMVRNLSSLVHAVDTGPEFGPPIGDA